MQGKDLGSTPSDSILTGLFFIFLNIKYKDKTIVFAADLLPSIGHIPLPYVMGYDTKPLVTLTEKEKFLNEAADKEYILFLQHDNYSECCTVQHTEKGVRLKDKFSLSEIL